MVSTDIQRCMFDGNKASSEGGASLAQNSGTVMVSDTTHSSNSVLGGIGPVHPFLSATLPIFHWKRRIGRPSYIERTRADLCCFHDLDKIMLCRCCHACGNPISIHCLSPVIVCSYTKLCLYQVAYTKYAHIPLWYLCLCCAVCLAAIQSCSTVRTVIYVIA